MATKRPDTQKHVAPSTSSTSRSAGSPSPSGYQSVNPPASVVSSPLVAPRSTVTAKAAASRPKVSLAHDQIAARARAIWLKKGCPTGQDESNWLQAEAELRAEMGA